MVLRRITTVLLATLAVLSVALAVVWFARLSVASWAVEQAFRVQGVPASARFTRLDFTGLAIEDLSLGAPVAAAITADRAEASFHVGRLFAGQIDRVSLHGLVVRAEWTDGGLQLSGFPPPSEEGDGGAGGAMTPLPPTIEIPDARLLLDTPVGAFAADITAMAEPGEHWRVAISADVAEAAARPLNVRLERAEAEIELADGAAEGVVALELANLDMDEFDAERLALSGDFSGRFDGDPSWRAVDGDGTISFDAGGAMFEPEAASRLLDRVLASESLADSAPIEAHIVALREALERALTALDAEGELSVQSSGGRLSWRVDGPLAVRAESGMTASLFSTAGGASALVMDLEEESWVARDLVAHLRGGGGPDVRAELRSVNLVLSADEGERFEAHGTVRMQPWRADGLAVTLERTSVDVEGDDAGWRVETDGRARLSGERGELRIGDLLAVFQLEGELSDDGLAIRSHDGAQLSLTGRRVGYADIEAPRAEVTFAPLDPYPLLSIDENGVGGAMQLRDISGDLNMADVPWSVSAPAGDVRLDSVESGLAIEARVQAPQATGVREPNDETIDLRADVLAGEAEIGAAVQTGARVEGLRVGGSGAPVRLARAAAEVELAFEDGAIATGRAALAGAELRDVTSGRRFAPLSLEGTATVNAGQVTGSAAASLLGGITVARAAFSHDFSTMTGEATGSTERLSFAPRGLQPSDLAPITLGYLANVRGGVRALGGVSWGADGASAEGLLEVDGLDFDMQVGRVEGLRGVISIADMMKGATSEPQRLSVTLVDVGLPLENGQMAFQLSDGWRFQLDEAGFSMAGGELTLEPMEWVVGEPELRAAFIVTDLDLARMIALFKPPDLEVVGRVNGRIPVVARENSLFVEEGRLSTLGDGRIAYTGGAADTMAGTHAGVDLAFEALRDFRYDSLTIDVNGDLNGRMYLSMLANGRNPAVQDGVPIEFTLNTTAEFARLIQSGLNSLDLGATVEDAQREEEMETSSGPAMAEDAP